MSCSGLSLTGDHACRRRIEDRIAGQRWTTAENVALNTYDFIVHLSANRDPLGVVRVFPAGAGHCRDCALEC